MLSLDRISQIKMLLTSDRFKLGGHEVLVVAQIIQDLHNEEQRLIAEARVKEMPKRVTPMVAPVPEASGVS